MHTKFNWVDICTCILPKFLKLINLYYFLESFNICLWWAIYKIIIGFNQDSYRTYWKHEQLSIASYIKKIYIIIIIICKKKNKVKSE